MLSYFPPYYTALDRESIVLIYYFHGLGKTRVVFLLSYETSCHSYTSSSAGRHRTPIAPQNHADCGYDLKKLLVLPSIPKHIQPGIESTTPSSIAGQ